MSPHEYFFLLFMQLKEENNVILSLHQGSKVQKGIRLSVDKQDEENRVWYVGSTRARNNLYLLKAKKKTKEYKL